MIGDQNATVGSSVTFWGPQWASANGLSGGAAPASFRGFENGNPAPACGGTWTSDSDERVTPPASVPPLMGVIVSHQITKSGGTTTGDIQEIVIVQVNPADATGSGHARTGTVVAVAPCDASQAAQIQQLEARINALTQQNQQLQGQVTTLTDQNQSFSATITNAVTSVQQALRQAANDPRLTIPGANPQQQLQNIVTAIQNLARSQLAALYRNLGGRP